MAVNLKGRSLLAILDYSVEEINYMLELAHKLKAEKKAGKPHRHLEGKNIALIFQKTSTRTRCSFEVAASDLGMGSTYIGPSGSQMGAKESMEDTAIVLGNFYDAIEFRGFKQSDVEILAEKSGVPVFNGLTDEFHPTQMIADFMTIQESHGKDLKGKKFVFVGDARNNVSNSLMIMSVKMGMHFVAAAPKDLWPEKELMDKAEAIAKETGATITFEVDIMKAVKGAHVIYSDIWVSMGEPKEIWKERISILKPYQVTMDVMKAADSSGIFMHCLPAFHDTNTEVGKMVEKDFGFKNGIEVTDEVFRSKQARQFEEAENRMHSIKAIILSHMKG